MTFSKMKLRNFTRAAFILAVLSTAPAAKAMTTAEFIHEACDTRANLAVNLLTLRYQGDTFEDAVEWITPERIDDVILHALRLVYSVRLSDSEGVQELQKRNIRNVFYQDCVGILEDKFNQ